MSSIPGPPSEGDACCLISAMARVGGDGIIMQETWLMQHHCMDMLSSRGLAAWLDKACAVCRLHLMAPDHAQLWGWIRAQGQQASRQCSGRAQHCCEWWVCSLMRPAWIRLDLPRGHIFSLEQPATVSTMGMACGAITMSSALSFWGLYVTDKFWSQYCQTLMDGGGTSPSVRLRIGIRW